MENEVVSTPSAAPAQTPTPVSQPAQPATSTQPAEHPNLGAALKQEFGKLNFSDILSTRSGEPGSSIPDVVVPDEPQTSQEHSQQSSQTGQDHQSTQPDQDFKFSDEGEIDNRPQQLKDLPEDLRTQVQSEESTGSQPPDPANGKKPLSVQEFLNTDWSKKVYQNHQTWDRYQKELAPLTRPVHEGGLGLESIPEPAQILAAIQEARSYAAMHADARSPENAAKFADYWLSQGGDALTSALAEKVVSKIPPGELYAKIQANLPEQVLYEQAKDFATHLMATANQAAGQAGVDENTRNGLLWTAHWLAQVIGGMKAPQPDQPGQPAQPAQPAQTAQPQPPQNRQPTPQERELLQHRVNAAKSYILAPTDQMIGRYTQEAMRGLLDTVPADYKESVSRDLSASFSQAAIDAIKLNATLVSMHQRMVAGFRNGTPPSKENLDAYFAAVRQTVQPALKARRESIVASRRKAAGSGAASQPGQVQGSPASTPVFGEAQPSATPGQTPAGANGQQGAVNGTVLQHPSGFQVNMDDIRRQANLLSQR